MLPLDWDRRGRVTPAGTESQEAWPGAEPGCESPGESRGEAPEGERAPDWRASAPGHRQAATFVGAARTLVGCAFRRSASLFLPEGESFLGVVVGKARARMASRERLLLFEPHDIHEEIPLSQIGRRFGLSDERGSGVSCDEKGVFVGAVPLLELCHGRKGLEQWRPRAAADLNRDLSKRYGLPVEFNAKLESSRGGRPGDRARRPSARTDRDAAFADT